MYKLIICAPSGRTCARLYLRTLMAVFHEWEKWSAKGYSARIEREKQVLIPEHVMFTEPR